MPKLVLRLLLVAGSLLPASLLLLRGPWHSCRPAAHRHIWRPARPPGGAVRLLDDHGRRLVRLRPAQIARIEVIGLPNVDQCIAPDCPFGPDGMAAECEGPRVLEYSDGDAGGHFGRQDAGGPFHPLSPSDVAHITHYRAPLHCGVIRISARFDDIGRTIDAESRWIPTFDDPPTSCLPWRCLVTAPTHLARR
jgi:hypothetical protein